MRAQRPCLLLLHHHSMTEAPAVPATAGIDFAVVHSLLPAPSDEPIVLATPELDLLADCIAQSAGPFLLRVPTCPTLYLKVGICCTVTDLLLRLCACTRVHYRARQHLLRCSSGRLHSLCHALETNQTATQTRVEAGRQRGVRQMLQARAARTRDGAATHAAEVGASKQQAHSSSSHS